MSDFETFEREDIKFFFNSHNEFGLDKDFVLEVVFNEDVQEKWHPHVGDIIIGKTGNLFVISGSHRSLDSIGGIVYFFGGHLCNRDGGNYMNSTKCYAMNKKGISYNRLGEPEEYSRYSSFSDYRWIPRSSDELKRAGLKDD